jgi:hypothetical protein
MRIRIGNYRLGIAATELSISTNQVLGATGTPVAVDVVWDLQTRLKNPTGVASAFYSTLAAFENAFSQHGQDVVLELSDGTSSYHTLLNRNCIGGTRITKYPTYSSGRSGEGINYRNASVQITGTVPISSFGYTAFSERISISGGGARWGCREVNRGPGIRQQLRTHTTCRATQSGSAVGYLETPEPPPPIWAYALVDELPEVGLDNPNTIGLAFNASQTDYGINWSYQFAFPQRLSGTPHFLTGF